MKIGILTTYFADYGSFCHATALYNFLEKMGHNCEFINECVRYKVSKRLYAGHLLLKLFPDFIVSKMVPVNTMLKNYYYITKELQNYKISERFNEISDITSQYDCIIIGADELWSLTNKNIRYIPEYFGIGIDCPIITYATSGITLKNFERNISKTIKKNLRKIKCISVRDTVTQKWVSKVIKSIPPIVLDPALLNPYYVPQKAACIEEDYILVYGEEFSEAQKNRIIIFSSLVNKRLVSVIWSHSWCSDNISIKSNDELQLLFAKASYCVTSTFHGTVFAIANHIQFTAFISELRGAKVVCLLQQLDLERKIYDLNPKGCLDRDIDYTLIDRKLEMMKKSSEEFLISSLEELKMKREIC